MLKLVKYDFRRNRDQIWVSFGLLILLQLGIWISAELSNWTREAMLVSNVTSYIIVGVVILVQACRTYTYNLKAYHRRLLPLKEVYTVLSPLLLNLFLLAGLAALAAVHLGLYDLFGGEWIPANLWPAAFTVGFLLLWTACFQFILLMLAITVACSLRIKGRIWIGIATLFLLQNGIDALGRWIFGEVSYTLDNVLQFHVTAEGSLSNGGMTVSGAVFPVWATVYETVLAVVLIYVITVLIKKRVEN